MNKTSFALFLIGFVGFLVMIFSSAWLPTLAAGTTLFGVGFTPNAFIYLPYVVRYQDGTPSPTPTATPSSTPTPTNTPAPIPEPGSWIGITSREHPMSFNVSEDSTEWTLFELETDAQIGPCNVTTTITLGSGNIVNGHFSHFGSDFSFSGQFDTSTTTSGTYTFSNFYVFGCGYFSQSGTWIAGNGFIPPTPTPGPTATPAPITPPPVGSVAFTSNRDGNYEIYSITADGLLHRLTDNSAQDDEAAWSPDGTKIAFHSNRDGNYEIYVMNADGTGVTRLTSDSAGDWGPTWSPDSTQIAFQSNRNGSQSDIFIMNTDGSGVVNATNTLNVNEIRPDWSHDGLKFAYYQSYNNVFSIFSMNVDGSNLTWLSYNVPTTNDNFGPDWSPNNTQIAFYSDSSTNPTICICEIYLMTADGSVVTNLTNNPAEDTDPSWSPDGAYITFTTDRDGNMEIYVMNADGTGPINLTNHPADDINPDWH